MITLLLFFILNAIVGATIVPEVPDQYIVFNMTIWIEPDYQDGYLQVPLYVVDYDIPKVAAYQLPSRIVVEERSLLPTYVTPSGLCYNLLWHEILHAKWDIDVAEAHAKMAREKHCA
jgi:hypothetical protein